MRMAPLCINRVRDLLDAEWFHGNPDGGKLFMRHFGLSERFETVGLTDGESASPTTIHLRVGGPLIGWLVVCIVLARPELLVLGTIAGLPYSRPARVRKRSLGVARPKTAYRPRSDRLMRVTMLFQLRSSLRRLCGAMRTHRAPSNGAPERIEPVPMDRDRLAAGVIGSLELKDRF
jgi:hypothetical protein